MSLRVIAGSARGMRLKAVPGQATRPIMDRVKEALFSIIGNEIRGARFLDLFAGTGSVGIEALSRGAAHAVFLDIDRAALGVIRANLAHTRLARKATVLRRSAFNLLHAPPERDFDFIFIAPPQYRGKWLKTLRALDDKASWRNADCLVIAQIDPREHDAAADFANLRQVDRRVYGNTMLIFYRFEL